MDATLSRLRQIKRAFVALPPTQMLFNASRRLVQFSMRHFASAETFHRFWRTPPYGREAPESYLTAPKHAHRTALLLSVVQPRLDPSARVLELGCNAGRNLQALWEAGFRQLTAVEINAAALRVLRQTHPALASTARLYTGAIEEDIRTFADDSFDLVFSVAVLEHLPPTSEWVFSEIARVTRRSLITIESETGYSWNIFPRDYSKVFLQHGLVQESWKPCSTECGSHLVMRLFRRVGQG